MNDTDIIELFFSRSEEAIRQLAVKYGRLGHSIANKILRSHEDTEECMNSTYLKLWNTIPPQRPDDLMAYFAAIVRSSALDIYRSQHRKKRRADTVDLAVADWDADIAQSDFAEQLGERLDLSDTLNRFLAAMPERDRMIFMRRYWFFDSVKEISRRSGINENTVKTVLSRSRQKLLTMLKEEGLEI